MKTQKIDTQTIQTEKAIIGFMINNPDKLNQVADYIHEDDFLDRRASATFRLINNMKKSGMGIDVLSVSKKTNEENGDVAWVSSSTDELIPSATVSFHVATILQSGRKKRLCEKLNTILEQTKKGPIADDEILSDIQKLYEDESSRGQEFQKHQVINASEFLSLELPPRKNLLSPWLPMQGITEIHAQRGIGKTHVALGVTCAVASGGNFLKWKAEQPTGVLFIDGELPAKVLQKWFAEMLRATNSTPAAPILFMTPDLQKLGMPDLATDEGQREIEKHITKDISLIVLDNLSTLVRSGDENTAEGWHSIQGWFLKLRSRGVSTLFIHHSGKTGKQRGTSKREDVLDTVINLKHPKDYKPEMGACFEVHFEKTRGIFGEDTKSFQAHLQGDEWLIKSIEQNNKVKVSELHNEGYSQTEIAKKLGINKSTVSRHLKKGGISENE